MATIEQVDAVIGKPVNMVSAWQNKPWQVTIFKRVDKHAEFSSSSCSGKIHIDSIVSIEPVAPKPVQTELEKEIRKMLTSEENNLLDRWLGDGKQGPHDEWIGRLVARSLKEITKGI